MPAVTTRPSSTANFTIQRARFGRAPRVVIPSQLKRTAPKPVRTSSDSAFDKRFSRMAHRLRFREVAKTMAHFGDVHERICKSYATYSIRGVQFAVVKPLTDGRLRIGVALPDDNDLNAPVGLGGSDRITGQFTLKSYEPLRGEQIGYLRSAFDGAVAEARARP